MLINTDLFRTKTLCNQRLPLKVKTVYMKLERGLFITIFRIRHGSQLKPSFENVLSKGSQKGIDENDRLLSTNK